MALMDSDAPFIRAAAKDVDAKLKAKEWATLKELYRDGSGEVRVIDPITGGAKGSKLARFDMIPSDILWELAEHYGKGEAKYPSNADGTANWQNGYSWRLSVAAMQRHLHAFIQGEETDDETGSSHLVAVIWHAIALRWFQLHGKGTDYRTKMR